MCGDFFLCSDLVIQSCGDCEDFGVLGKIISKRKKKKSCSQCQRVVARLNRSKEFWKFSFVFSCGEAVSYFCVKTT